MFGARVYAYLIAASLATLLSPAVARSPESGTWTVDGEDTEQWRAKMVLNSDGERRYHGYFIWSAPAAGKSGEELFKGNYDEQSGMLFLTGYEIRKENGIAMGSYRAKVSADGKDLDGKWGSNPNAPGAADGFWHGKWQAAETPALPK